MLPAKAKTSKINNAADLKNFKGVTHHAWTLDKATLNEMDIDYTTATTYSNMFLMINSDRTDFLMTSFSSFKDMKQTKKNITLLPVKGIKVILSGARSFVVNKKDPNAKLIFVAIQKGLKILKQKGRIKQYFQVTGFINPKIKNWKVLCCHSLDVNFDHILKDDINSNQNISEIHLQTYTDKNNDVNL
jgi:hypothetical protein